MRFIQYTKKDDATDKVHVGVEKKENGDIIPLSSDPSIPLTLIELISKYEENIQKIQKVVEAGSQIGRNSVNIIAPITKPDKVLCVGMNYIDHCTEQNCPVPTVPVIFNKFPSCIAGPNDTIPYPTITNELDWEVELAIVIGKKCKSVSKEEAGKCIFGYTAAHDVSARDWQMKKNGGQWLIGKSMNSFFPIGPCVVTQDSIDQNNLNVQTKVNGVVKQKSNTSQLAHKCKDLVSFCSNFITLLPGDLISTGTPGGVGVFRNPPEFLKVGDEVELQIENIGIIRNTIVTSS